jgi:hypothetical protein
LKESLFGERAAWGVKKDVRFRLTQVPPNKPVQCRQSGSFICTPSFNPLVKRLSQIHRDLGRVRGWFTFRVAESIIPQGSCPIRRKLGLIAQPCAQEFMSRGRPKTDRPSGARIQGDAVMPPTGWYVQHIAGPQIVGFSWLPILQDP